MITLITPQKSNIATENDGWKRGYVKLWVCTYLNERQVHVMFHPVSTSSIRQVWKSMHDFETQFATLNLVKGYSLSTYHDTEISSNNFVLQPCSASFG